MNKMNMFIILMMLLINFHELTCYHNIRSIDDLMISNKEIIIKVMFDLKISTDDEFVIFVYQQQKDSLNNWVKNRIIIKNQENISITILFFNINNKNYFKLITDSVVYKEIEIKKDNPLDFKILKNLEYSKEEIKHDFPIGIYEWYSGIVYSNKNKLSYFKFIDEFQSEINTKRKNIIDTYKFIIEKYLDYLEVDYTHNE